MDYEIFVNWMIETLPKTALADLCEAVEDAGKQAVEMVKVDALHGPYIPELIYDDLAYRLPDALGISARPVLDPDSGVEVWSAYRDETDGSPQVHGCEYELYAIAALLRKEAQAGQS